MQHTATAIYAIFFNLCSVLYKPESCALALFIDLNIDLGFRRKLVSRDVCHLFSSATCLSLQEVGVLKGQGRSGMTRFFVASEHNHTYTPSKWHINGTCLSVWIGNWASKVAQKNGEFTHIFRRGHYHPLQDWTLLSVGPEDLILSHRYASLHHSSNTRGPRKGHW